MNKIRLKILNIVTKLRYKLSAYLYTVFFVLKNNICEKYYICSRGIGDTIIFLSRLNNYYDKYGKKVNIIIAENQKCLIKPYKNYINKSIVLPTSKIILLTEMVYNYKIYENKLQFILPSDAEKLLSKSNLFDLMGSTLDITGDDFEPPNFGELDVNDVFVGELESLRDEKYVFLAPASVSVSQIEQSVWKEIADICKKYGFIVVENENKNYQQKIGDIEVFKSIDETYLIAKKASFIISARSGLSDLLAYTKSPMMVIYPNKWSLEKFTFSKMPFSRHIIEIVEDGKLIQIVEEMLCH